MLGCFCVFEKVGCGYGKLVGSGYYGVIFVLLLLIFWGVVFGY